MILQRLALHTLSVTFAIMLIPALDGLAAEPVDAREPDDSAPKDEFADARLKYMTRALQKYTVGLDGDEEKRATLDPKVMMRWSNPVGDVVDGLLSIYTTGPAARPSMIAHFHLHGPVLNGLEMHEFADVHPGTVDLTPPPPPH